MFAANAGFKYQGWSLEGEYYARWLNEFETIGFIPVTHLFDQGFQVQASTMLIRDELQPYVTGSKIFGEYGDPWDTTLGFNWYPLGRREVRINGQASYFFRSPVGSISLPYQVGSNGWIYNVDFIVAF